MAEIEKATSKGEPIVQYCAICGVEFDDRLLTNRWCQCDSCENIFHVKSRTEYKREPDEVENE